MSIHDAASQKAIAILNSINAKYKIILEDGTERSNIVEETKKKKVFLRPVGTAIKHFLPYIENTEVGQLVEVPYGDFRGEELRGPLVAYCCRIWGKGSYMSSLNNEKRVVELIRYA